MINRREFNSRLVRLLCLSLASTIVPLKALQAGVQKLKKVKNGIVYIIGLGPEQVYINSPEVAALVPSASKILLWDRERNHLSIDIPFLPHSCAQHPVLPHIVSFVGRYHTEAIVYDLFEKKIIATAKAASQSRFFGHSCFSKDGSLFFISENNDEKKYSLLTGWSFDKSEAKRVVEIPTGGKRIHDCQLSLDGSHVITCSTRKGGDDSEANMTWINAKTYKIEKQIKFADNGPGHFHQIPDGYIAFGGGSNFKIKTVSKSVFGIVDKAGNRIDVKIPENMLSFFIGETLSLSSSPKNSLVFATLPESNSVFVINYKTAEFIRRLEFQSPSGITVTEDQKHFIVSERSQPAKLVWVNTQSFEVEKSQSVSDLVEAGSKLGWSSHIAQIENLKISTS